MASERNRDQLDNLLLSDLENEDSNIGSMNVYALSSGPNRCWQVLSTALRRTPFTDYASEWVSIAIRNTKQFLADSFNKALQNSNNGKRYNMVLIDDEIWSSYDKRTSRNKGKISLIE